MTIQEIRNKYANTLTAHCPDSVDGEIYANEQEVLMDLLDCLAGQNITKDSSLVPTVICTFCQNPLSKDSPEFDNWIMYRGKDICSLCFNEIQQFAKWPSFREFKMAK